MRCTRVVLYHARVAIIIAAVPSAAVLKDRFGKIELRPGTDLMRRVISWLFITKAMLITAVAWCI